MPGDVETYGVMFRTNGGEDHTAHAAGLAEAMEMARVHRTVDNHMVCVVQDGQDLHRWDRDRVVNQNKWRKVDPRAFQTLGPIRACTVRYVHITAEEEQAQHKAWLESCPEDNQDFANALTRQIAADVEALAPSVHKAISDVYDGLGIPAMLELFRKAPASIDTYREYRAFQARLGPLDPKSQPFTFKSQCCGITHPSVDLSPTVLEELRARGFRSSFIGWCDARGVQIEDWDWLELRRVRKDPSAGYDWNDPAGIREIYQTYTRALQKLSKAAGPTVRAFEQGNRAGRAAYLDGHPVTACTVDTRSLVGYGWISGWQSGYQFRADLPYSELQRLRESGHTGEIPFDLVPFRPRSSARA
ncbi:type IV pilus biogenesis protein PilI [Pseudomonas guariconensis]|uniref:type IV pilus biogenesis protein PilI n=1 Tax=Pseudomonas guariconensis TaxID=1288410 RepID=UPI0039068F64